MSVAGGEIGIIRMPVKHAERLVEADLRQFAFVGGAEKFVGVFKMRASFPAFGVIGEIDKGLMVSL